MRERCRRARAAITIGKWLDVMGLDRPVRAPRPANSDERQQ